MILAASGYSACSRDSQVAQDTNRMSGSAYTGAATFSFIQAIERGGTQQSYAQVCRLHAWLHGISYVSVHQGRGPELVPPDKSMNKTTTARLRPRHITMPAAEDFKQHAALCNTSATQLIAHTDPRVHVRAGAPGDAQSA